MEPQKTIQLKQVIASGLRKTASVDPMAGLVECYNRKPKDGALVAFPTILNPYEEDGEYPYPQTLKGHSSAYTLVYDSDANVYDLKALNTANMPWIIGDSVLNDGGYNANTMLLGLNGSHVPFVGSGLEQLLELNDCFILLTGTCMVSNSPIFKDQYGTDYWYGNDVAHGPVPLTGCINDGQLILGGFDDNNAWWTASGFGKRVWDLWNKRAPVTSFTKGTNIPNRKFIMWGLPGGGEASMPFAIEMILLTGVDSQDKEAIILDQVRDWRIGFCFIPWNGNILALKKLGNDIIVYTDNGIGYLRAIEGGYTCKYLTDLGIMNGLCVAGDDNSHVFIDKQNRIWTIKNNLQFQLQDYSEFITQLSDDIRCSFDSLNDDVYISGGPTLYGPKGYCFNRSLEVLSEVQNAPWSLTTNGTSLLSPVQSGSGGFLIKTQILDAGTRAVKTVDFIEIGKSTFTDITATLDFKAKTGSMISGDPETPTEAGIVDFVQSCIDFQITVAGTDSEDDETIQYMNAIIRTTGKLGMLGY